MRPSPSLTVLGARTSVVEVWHWGLELEHLYTRIASRFARPEPRWRALTYLKGVVSSVTRRNGWQLTEYAGEARPDGMQWVLSSAVWNADLACDDLRAYILERLGDPQAIIVIDQTSFRKRGKKSCALSGTIAPIESYHCRNLSVNCSVYKDTLSGPIRPADEIYNAKPQIRLREGSRTTVSQQGFTPVTMTRIKK